MEINAISNTKNEVIELLEAAISGNRTLSAAVLRAIGWDWECIGCAGGGMWKNPDGAVCGDSLAAVTEEPDAARALIPEGVQVATSTGSGMPWKVSLHATDPAAATVREQPVAVAEGATLALALCGAAVKLAGL